MVKNKRCSTIGLLNCSGKLFRLLLRPPILLPSGGQVCVIMKKLRDQLLFRRIIFPSFIRDDFKRNECLTLRSHKAKTFEKEGVPKGGGKDLSKINRKAIFMMLGKSRVRQNALVKITAKQVLRSLGGEVQNALFEIAAVQVFI